MKVTLKLKKLFILINTFSFYSMEENLLIPDELQQQKDFILKQQELIQEQKHKLVGPQDRIIQLEEKIENLNKMNEQQEKEKDELINLIKSKDVHINNCFKMIKQFLQNKGNLEILVIQQIEEIKNFKKSSKEKDHIIEILQSSKIKQTEELGMLKEQLAILEENRKFKKIQ
jgi:hypothetical protein